MIKSKSNYKHMWSGKYLDGQLYLAEDLDNSDPNIGKIIYYHMRSNIDGIEFVGHVMIPKTRMHEPDIADKALKQIEIMYLQNNLKEIRFGVQNKTILVQ